MGGGLDGGVDGQDEEQEEECEGDAVAAHGVGAFAVGRLALPPLLGGGRQAVVRPRDVQAAEGALAEGVVGARVQE